MFLKPSLTIGVNSRKLPLLCD